MRLQASRDVELSISEVWGWVRCFPACVARILTIIKLAHGPGRPTATRARGCGRGEAGNLKAAANWRRFDELLICDSFSRMEARWTRSDRKSTLNVVDVSGNGVAPRFEKSTRSVRLQAVYGCPSVSTVSPGV